MLFTPARFVGKSHDKIPQFLLLREKNKRRVVFFSEILQAEMLCEEVQNL